MPWVWISVGSNIKREESLREAIRRLRVSVGELVVSSVYESAAVGSGGPPFYNLVVGFETARSIRELDTWLRSIEDALGRRRGGDKFAPRTLDLDLLTYGDCAGEYDGIALPRDEILRYAFVLAPLAEVAPGERLPGDGRCYAQLWAAFAQETQPIERVPFRFE